MSEALENHRGVEIFRTSDLTLVTSPAGRDICIYGREGDEGPNLLTFTSIEEAREYIDDAEPLARN